MVSDAESLGAQDRIPREAIEAAARALYKRAQDEAGGDPSWDNLYATEQESWLGDARAAYPLIRERVCQELAEAMKNGEEVWRLALKVIHGLAAAQPGNPPENWNEADARVLTETLASEFVESFGASPGGEHG